MQIKKVIEKFRLSRSKILIFCTPVRNITIRKDDGIDVSLHAKVVASFLNGDFQKDDFSSIKFSNYDINDKLKKVVFISSYLSKEEKEDVIANFTHSNSKTNILCSVGMLIEGFDFPELENLILLLPTKSIRLYEQQVGRVLRKSNLNPNKIANIFELRDDYYSLIDEFGEMVFNHGYIENITQLDPFLRLDTIIYDEKIDSRKIREMIQINELHLKNGDIIENRVLRLPFLKTRIKFTNRIIQQLHLAKEGKLQKQRFALFKFIQKYRITAIDDIDDINKIVRDLKEFENQVLQDTSLTQNCKKSKLSILQDLSSFIRLKILTQIKESDIFDQEVKAAMLSKLGFSHPLTEIDHLREKMATISNKTSMKTRKRTLNNLVGFTKQKKLFGVDSKMLVKNLIGKNKKLIEDFFILSCFITDDPTIEKKLYLLEKNGILSSIINQ